jgi:phage replication initiation protein
MANPVFAPLVIDGDTVKMRVLAERQFHGRSVHVDWVRFTCLLRNSPVPNADVLFTRWDSPDLEIQDANRARSLMDFHASEFQATVQANELAHRIAGALGADFQVSEDVKKGMDFYKYRWSITLNGNECAWVGFLSSSDSPRQSKQAGTIHANITGTACTFASPGWSDRMADLVEECDGTLTRADLALDFFDGYPGGIDAVRTAYREGLCNVGGRKLKFNLVGDWENGHDRSVYIGSREAGKITNVYEKGDQLYGEKANSDWVRFELRYGNKFRVLSSEILRRPDDFFAGASDWHESVMLQAAAISSAEKVPCLPRLQIESCTAEVSRNLRWLKNTAASSLKVAIEFLDHDELLQLIGNAVLPGRLRKFSKSQIADCFSPAVKVVTALPALVRVPGTVATYSFFSANPSPMGFQAA